MKQAQKEKMLRRVNNFWFWTTRFWIWRDKRDYALIVPSDWPQFNRMCWRVYGTGRTEPDKVER